MNYRLPRIFLPVVLLLLALAIRLYDLTDLPLDFHLTRQLLSALKARGMYYQTLTEAPGWQRQFAIQQWKSKAEIEPEIVERLTAFTYRITGEQLWVGRLYSISFWIIGGIFLFLVLRELVSENGALFGMAFYLFLPYAVIASRSFQPDPLMVMFVLMFWWAVVRWVRQPASWTWAGLAGLFGGLAILIKFSAAFFVIGGGLGALLGHQGLLKTMRRPQTWTMMVLGILPGAVYLVNGVFIAGFLGRQFSGRFIPSLLISPSYYLNWTSTLNHVLGGVTFALALLGLFFYRERSARLFVLGLWAAYFLYGIYFDYHIWSHDYYNLPLIPIAAASLAALSDWFMAHLTEAAAGSRVGRLIAASIMAFGLFAVIMEVRATLKATDYRPEAALWSDIGHTLGPEARVVALTEDYGSRLAYWGWLDSAAWPLTGDLQYHVDLRGAQGDFEERFDQLALKRDFFLVADMEELVRQVQLAQRLESYPVFARGDGYIIYDLRAAAVP